MKGSTIVAIVLALVLAVLLWFAWRRGALASVGFLSPPPPPGPTPKEYGPAAPQGGQGFSSATGAVYGTTYGVVCTGLTGGAGGPMCGAAVRAGDVVGTGIEKGAKKIYNTVKGWF